MRSITSRLSYANVVSTLALFVALGGSSYAVTTDGPQARPAQAGEQPTARGAGQTGNDRPGVLRAGSVKSEHIGNGQVTSLDIAYNGVYSVDIRDGTITVADLSPELIARLRKAPKTPETNGDNGDDDDGNGGEGTTTTPTTTTPNPPAPPPIVP